MFLSLLLIALLSGCSDLSQNQEVVPATASTDTPVDPAARTEPASAVQADAIQAGAQPADGDPEPDEPSAAAVPNGDGSDTGASSTPAADAVALGQSGLDNGRPLDQTTNILLLGSDRRDDTPNWRTDVMMIIALDRENGRAGVISIPRDVFIAEIPGHQPNKINVIDYLGEMDEPEGGPALLASIIERDMGIPIHHYLRFSFDSFRAVVDALDGVPVDIDCSFSGFIEDEGGWLVLEPGTHRLTGNQAMIYVRDRQLTGGDLSRARRQQRFVWAVRNQVLDENLLTRIPGLYTALAGSVDTDIGLVTTLQLARLALALDPEDLYGVVLAPPDLLEEGWALGMSVFLPDWATIAESVQTVFDSPPFIVDNTPENCR